MGVCGSPFLTSNANTLIHAFAYRVDRVMAANQQQPPAPAPAPAPASVHCVALFRLTHTSDCRCRIVEETKKPLGGRAPGGRGPAMRRSNGQARRAFVTDSNTTRLHCVIVTCIPKYHIISEAHISVSYMCMQPEKKMHSLR